MNLGSAFDFCELLYRSAVCITYEMYYLGILAFCHFVFTNIQPTISYI